MGFEERVDKLERGVFMSEQEITDIAVLKEQVNSLKDRLGTLEKDVQSKFDRIEKKLDDAIKGRPTWAMAIILGGMMTVCTSLVVFILTK